MPVFLMRHDIAIAWAAGLFEGEGCFYLASSTQRPGATLRMTDFDIVERFCSVVGLGSVSGPHLKQNPKHKPQWAWTAYGEDVRRLYEMFAPYLGERRTSKALSVIAAADRHQQDLRERTGTCEQCSTEFVGKRPSARFCTRKCRDRNKYERLYQKVAA